MSNIFPKTFSNFTLGVLELKNRIMMAPLTRQSSEDDGTPTDEMVAYYARRARGGVSAIITEGTYPTDELGCIAYLNQPGCANSKHVQGWKKVVDAVHENGSKIILQLMHGGRVSDPRCLLEGDSPVSSSSTQSPGAVLYTDTDDEMYDRGISPPWPKVNFPKARELSVEEIKKVAKGFAESAERAMEAGFDGIEIHGANGYLYYQFIDPKQNLRTDQYGGSAENNLRAVNEVSQIVKNIIGKQKALILRLSQDGVDDFQGQWPGGISYAEELGTCLKNSHYDALHWSSFDWKDNRDNNSNIPMPKVLSESSGLPIIVNGGISEGKDIEEIITSGSGVIGAVGRPLFAHPDWPYIIRSGEQYPWIEFDRKYVVKPTYDYKYGYPLDLKKSSWNPDLSKRRKKE